MKHIESRLALFAIAALLGHAPLLWAAQTCNTALVATTPTAEFSDPGDGTVIHQRTGLMWKRCAEGQSWNGATCTGTATGFTWANALKAAVAATTGGHADWRLPNVKELESILEDQCVSPAINAAIFPATPATYFWSASTSAGNSSNAWYVLFDSGYADTNSKYLSAQVRLVRAGQSFSSFDTAAGGVALTVALTSGWNLIGNSNNAAIDVPVTFSDAANVTTVWKWIRDAANAARDGKWAFFSPALTAQALADYAASKGYEVLSVINAGEGFWVNAKATHTVTLPAGSAVLASGFSALPAGWSLVSVGEPLTPAQFNAATGGNLTTLWAWSGSSWYFYAPSLDTGTRLTDYIAGKGYLDFTASSKTLGPGTGFWVNRP